MACLSVIAMQFKPLIQWTITTIRPISLCASLVNPRHAVQNYTATESQRLLQVYNHLCFIKMFVTFSLLNRTNKTLFV